MKKISMRTLLNVTLCILLSVVLVGCSTHSAKAYTFKVDNGDRIKIKLDTSDGYDISSDIPFVLSCEDETVSKGIFIYSEKYEEYVSAVESDSEAEILDAGTKDGNEYIFWRFGDSEYNYAILINDSDTGIILGNAISEESARECFKRLKITVED